MQRQALRLGEAVLGAKSIKRLGERTQLATLRCARFHAQLDVPAGGLRAHILVQWARSRVGVSTGRCEMYELFLRDFASPSRGV